MTTPRYRPAAMLASAFSLASLAAFVGPAGATQGGARKPAQVQRATGQVVSTPGAPKPIVGDLLEGTNIRQQPPGQVMPAPGAPVQKPVIGDILDGTNIRQQPPGQAMPDPGGTPVQKPVLGDILQGTDIRRKEVNMPEGLPGR